MLKANLREAVSAVSRIERPAAQTAKLVQRLFTSIEFLLRDIVVDDTVLRGVTSSTLTALMDEARHLAVPYGQKTKTAAKTAVVQASTMKQLSAPFPTAPHGSA